MIGKFIINTSLMVISLLLSAILLPIGLIFGVITAFVKVKFYEGFDYISDMFLSIAIAIDQLGNTVCASLFNYTLIKRKESQHLFGNVDETISGVIGKNKISNTLSRTGKILDFILELFEKNHSIKSIEEDE